MLIHSDNGPEFISEKVVGWTTANGRLHRARYALAAHIKSFHPRAEEEILGGGVFCSLTAAQVVIGDWVDDFNMSRPQRSIGKLTPQEFLEKRQAEDDGSVRPRGQQLLESNPSGLT